VTRLCLAYRPRDQPAPFLLSLAGGLCLAATLAVFFIWIWPTNQSTDNWLGTTPDWATRRARWEYGHLASAALILAGFCLVVGSVLLVRTPIAGPAG
jgi:hypothetical protein